MRIHVHGIHIHTCGTHIVHVCSNTYSIFTDHYCTVCTVHIPVPFLVFISLSSYRYTLIILSSSLLSTSLLSSPLLPPLPPLPPLLPLLSDPTFISCIRTLSPTLSRLVETVLGPLTMWCDRYDTLVPASSLCLLVLSVSKYRHPA